MSVYLSFAARMAIDSIRNRNVKCAILNDYSQEFEHRVWADIMGFEVAGSGYPSGGKSVVLDVYESSFDMTVPVTCSPVQFGLLGVESANAVVFYDDTGDPNTSALMAADVFEEGGVEISGTNFTYFPNVWNLSFADTEIEPEP
jgi:hypothetical protein